MKAGWKNNPQWRMYVEMKRTERAHRLANLSQMRMMQEAIDYEAQLIVLRAADDAAKNSEPRH